jgi:hypothetical protein
LTSFDIPERLQVRAVQCVLVFCGVGGAGSLIAMLRGAIETPISRHFPPTH